MRHERGLSSIARLRLCFALPTSPRFTSMRVEASQRFQFVLSCLIASRIQALACTSFPSCSITSASCNAGLAAQGWIRRAFMAALSASAASPRATAAWLSPICVWASRGIAWAAASKPNGQPRRRLDTSRAERLFDFLARTSLREGLKRTVAWYLESLPH